MTHRRLESGERTSGEEPPELRTARGLAPAPAIGCCLSIRRCDAEGEAALALLSLRSAKQTRRAPVSKLKDWPRSDGSSSCVEESEILGKDGEWRACGMFLKRVPLCVVASELRAVEPAGSAPASSSTEGRTNEP